MSTLAALTSADVVVVVSRDDAEGSEVTKTLPLDVAPLLDR